MPSPGRDTQARTPVRLLVRLASMGAFAGSAGSTGGF